MTKDIFDSYDKLLYCRTCNRYVPKIHMHYKKVYANGNITRCNVCEWLRKHPDKKHIDGFDDDDVFDFIHFLFYNDSQCINDFYSTKKDYTIDELILLYKKLNLKNKKANVRILCDCCKKEYICNITPYLKHSHHYCSNECYYKNKSQTLDKGENSKFYNRVKAKCTNCGKEIKIIPSKYEKTNTYGDNHNFCCLECYWKYRSKYYIGEKSVSSNRVFTDAQREEQRQQCIKNLRHMPTKNTSIQLIIDNLLDSLNIEYEKEADFKYYSVDNHILNTDLCIEVMGDYWHGSPLYYGDNLKLINDIQYKDIIRDKRKRTYLKKYYNMSVLNLWETDINNNILLCEKLLLYYMDNKGDILDYNSFNWKLNSDNSICLNDDIIKPLYLYDTSDIKKYLKQ